MIRRRTVILLLAAVIAAAAVAVIWLSPIHKSSAPPRPDAAAPPALSPNEGKGVLEPPR